MPETEDLPSAPWIMPDGYLDLTKVPLEPIMRRTVGPIREDVRNAIGILGSIAQAGRREAAVYLLGLLADFPGDDMATLEFRGWVVESLKYYKTTSCAAALFGELRRVTSSNRTRRHLDTVIKVLSGFPPELVEEGFEDLAADKRFTPTMRDKFLRAASKAADNALF